MVNEVRLKVLFIFNAVVFLIASVSLIFLPVPFSLVLGGFFVCFGWAILIYRYVFGGEGF